MTKVEMDARIAARDAERDAAEKHRAFVEEDRREENLAISEIVANRKAS
jgi:hypothetical protein